MFLNAIRGKEIQMAGRAESACVDVLLLEAGENELIAIRGPGVQP
jgi:hypothetical protein